MSRDETEPRFITTPGGEELVLLSRRDYDRLVDRARDGADEDAEDLALARMAADARARIDSRRDILLPAEVAESIARGGNQVWALRLWRGLTQAQLAARAETNQGNISALENDRRGGSLPVMRAIAAVLDVPMETVLPNKPGN